MDGNSFGKIEILASTAAIVFAGGVAVIGVMPALRWVKAKAGALADWIDDGIDRVFGWFRRGGDAVRDLIEGDRIDWDYAAANAGSVVTFKQPTGQCPECFGQPGGNLRAENALLRANAAAGRAELQTLRHKLALAGDAITAADRRITALQAELVEASREVERLLRERSMAKLTPTARAKVKRTAARAAPGAGQHVEPEKQSRG